MSYEIRTRPRIGKLKQDVDKLTYIPETDVEVIFRGVREPGKTRRDEYVYFKGITRVEVIITYTYEAENVVIVKATEIRR